MANQVNLCCTKFVRIVRINWQILKAIESVKEWAKWAYPIAIRKSQTNGDCNGQLWLIQKFALFPQNQIEFVLVFFFFLSSNDFQLKCCDIVNSMFKFRSVFLILFTFNMVEKTQFIRKSMKNLLKSQWLVKFCYAFIATIRKKKFGFFFS